MLFVQLVLAVNIARRHEEFEVVVDSLGSRAEEVPAKQPHPIVPLMQAPAAMQVACNVDMCEKWMCDAQSALCGECDFCSPEEVAVARARREELDAADEWGDVEQKICVVFCDVPEHSTEMHKFLSVMQGCSRLIFVDPNIDNGNVCKLHLRSKYSDADEVPITECSGSGTYLDEIGAAQFEGVPVVADSAVTAAAIRKAGGDAPALIIDGGCPGVFHAPGIANKVMNERVWYEQIEDLMSAETTFVYFDYYRQAQDDRSGLSGDYLVSLDKEGVARLRTAAAAARAARTLPVDSA